MNKSRRNRGLLGATSLLCLALLSGNAWAEGADAADPTQQPQAQPNRRNNPQARPPQEQRRPETAAPNRESRPQEQRRRPETANPNPQQPPQQSRPANREPWANNNNQQAPATQERRRPEINRESRPQAQQARPEIDRRRDVRNDWRDRNGPPRWAEHGWVGPSAPPRFREYVYVGPERFYVPPERRRTYRNIVVLRPYGAWYHGYGRYYSDRDAYRWLGLTAITFGVLNLLNEQQQRALEDAQIAATTAPIGAPIVWGDPYARGTVVATRDGWSDGGRYCREFQQTVEIGGRVENAYGTACQQPDGSWQVTS